MEAVELRQTISDKAKQSNIGLASSFGSEDVVLINQSFTLDIGRLNQETYEVENMIQIRRRKGSNH